MIGLDTNVLVRYLVHDDEAQYTWAVRAMGELTPEEPGFISLVTLVETMWVLQRTYGVSRLETLAAVETLVANESIQFQDEIDVEDALALARSAGCDVADALVAVLGSGCTHTWTFDRKAARLPGMRLLGTPPATEPDAGDGDDA